MTAPRSAPPLSDQLVSDFPSSVPADESKDKKSFDCQVAELISLTLNSGALQYMSEAGAVAAPISFCRSDDPANSDQLERTTQVPGANCNAANQQGTAAPHELSAISNEQQACSRECFYDYSNGGPQFVADSAATSKFTSSCRVLAQYCDFEGAAAAVACSVGKGHAVLCGTHPELAPHWLGTADAPMHRQDVTGRAHCINTAESVRSKLEQMQDQRQHFWMQLLKACGLGAYLAEG